MAAYLGSQQISKIARVTFSGSSSPLVKTFPRGIGALLNPSGNADRNISLHCFWAVDTTKTEIERYQYSLNETLALRNRIDLSVNGNVYQNVIPRSCSQEILEQDEYFVYTMGFALDHAQSLLNSQVKITQVRDAYFLYEYGDIDQELSVFKFRFFDNWEAGISVDFDQKAYERGFRKSGTDLRVAGGVHKFALNCWIVREPTKELESYFFNFVAGSGPLGKKGTLYLNGYTYENVIMTAFANENITSGSGPTGVGQSNAKYTVEFQTSVQC